MIDEAGRCTLEAPRTLRRAERLLGHPGIPLESGDEIVAVAAAVLQSGLRARLDFGVLWPWYQEVRLCVTQGQLIEVAAPFGGWAVGRRIRAFRWTDLRSATFAGHDLRIELADGATVRWRIGRRTELASLRQAVDGRRGHAEGHETHETCSPLTPCPVCSAPDSIAGGACSACGTAFVTPPEAGWLSMLVPGGGHLATGHPVVGVARAVGDVALMCGLWLATTGIDWTFLHIPMTVTVIAVLAGFRLEAAMTARAFAHLLVPWSGGARRRWRVASAAGCLVLVAWAMSMLANARQTNLTVVEDLEFHAAEALGWRGEYEEPIDGDVDSPTLRSHWTHENGLTLSVLAQPLGRFQSPEEWARAQNALQIGTGSLAGQQFREGAVDGVRFERIDDTSGDAVAHLEYAVFDRVRRDVHTVVCEVAADQMAEADRLVQALLRRAHWTKAAEPCDSKSEPTEQPAGDSGR